MNENSPTCARSIPAVAATRMRRGRGQECAGGDRGLDDDEQRRDPEDERELPQQHRRIDEHAERDEEEARQDVAERANLGVRLVAVFALRQDQAAEKCAERHRDAQERTRPRRSDAREDHRQRKRFAPPAAGDQPEEHGQDEPADDRHHPDRATGLREYFRDDGERRAARKDRDEQQQDDDAEVLKEHDADDQASVRRIELVSAPQFLEHDRRARERDKEACEETEAPHRGRTRNRQHEEENGHRGDADLERARR